MNKFKHRNKADQPPYQYTMCGLDDVFLLSGYELVGTGYGSGVVIHDQDALHRAIGRYLSCYKKTLSGKEVRFLRHEMDLTQAELGRLLRVTDQTVARWEKGEVVVPGPEELLVRAYYLSHLTGKTDLVKLAQQLEAIEGETREKHVFAPTAKGWQRIAA